MAKDSLIRPDSSLQGLLSLEPLGELRRQGSQGWLSHQSPQGHLAPWLRSASSKQCLLAKDAKCLPGYSYYSVWGLGPMSASNADWTTLGSGSFLLALPHPPSFPVLNHCGGYRQLYASAGGKEMCLQSAGRTVEADPGLEPWAL